MIDAKEANSRAKQVRIDNAIIEQVKEDLEKLVSPLITKAVDNGDFKVNFYITDILKKFNNETEQVDYYRHLTYELGKLDYKYDFVSKLNDDKNSKLYAVNIRWSDRDLERK